MFATATQYSRHCLELHDILSNERLGRAMSADQSTLWDALTPANDELLAVGELAELLAEPGIPAEKIATQLRGYAQKDLIKSFGEERGSGRTAHRLYREDQWAIAKVLSILNDFGFADLKLMKEAARAMQMSRGDKSAHRQTAMQRAIEGFRQGEEWRLELMLLRDDRTGNKMVRARLRRPRTKQRAAERAADSAGDLKSRADLMIDLTPHLSRLLRRRASEKGQSSGSETKHV